MSNELKQIISQYSVKDDNYVIFDVENKDCRLNFPLKCSNDLFVVESKEYNDFFDALWNYYLSGGKYWTMEKQYTESIDKSGIMFDFDIYRKIEESVSATMMITIISKIAKIIYEQTDIPASTKTHVFVIKNDNLAKVEGFWKEGFHILFPGIKINKSLKTSIVLSASDKIKDLFENDDLKENDVLDVRSKYVPIQLYGAIRENKKESHKLSSAYEVVFGKSSQLKEITDMYRYARKSKIIPKYNLILELSVHYEGIAYEKKEYESREKAKEIINQNTQVFKNNIRNTIEFITKSVRTLTDTDYRARELLGYLGCIDLEKIREGYGKIEIIIKHILGVDVRYLTIAQLFAHKVDSDKWYGREADYKFNEFVKNAKSALIDNVEPKKTVSVKHFDEIKKMARFDNPAKFDTIKRKTLVGLVDAMLSMSDLITDNDIASVTKTLLNDRFYCVPLKKPGFGGQANYYWMEYLATEESLPEEMKPFVYKWYRHDTFPSTIDTLISKDINEVFREILSKYIERKKASEGDKNSGLDEIIKQIKSVIKKCGSHGGIMAIKARCQVLLESVYFPYKLDRDRSIMGVSNGIFRFTKNGVENLTGTMQFISQTTNIPYVVYNENAKTIKKVQKFLCDIMPEQKKLDGLMMHLSRVFTASNNNRYFNIFYSPGSSGKSLLMDLCSTTLGKRGSNGFNSNFGYYTTVEANVFMSDKLDVNGVDHHMMRLKGARLVHCPEGKVRGVIQNHIFKKLSDGVDARSMYESVQSFTFDGIIALLTNNVIKFSDYNFALSRRLLYVKFPVKFIPDYKETGDVYKRCMNDDIVQKVKKESWGTAFLSILANYWVRLQTYSNVEQMYKETGLYDETMEFLEQFNYYMVFTKRIVKAEGEDIALGDLYRTYIEFARKEDKNYNIEFLDFKNEIKEAYSNDIEDNILKGYKIV